MFLTDAELRAEIRAGRLIIAGDPGRATGASYEFRPGKIFPAGVGPDSVIDWTVSPSASAVFELKPGALAWIRMLETVDVPPNMLALWLQTNRFARQGLLLANASSLVDPGYRGPLSGTFVNFGAQSIYIRPNDAIVKIAVARFQAGDVEVPYPDHIGQDEYDARVHNLSMRAPRTFLDLEALGADIADQRTKAIHEVEALADTLKSQIADSMTSTTRALENALADAERALTSRATELGQEIAQRKPWAAIGVAGLGFALLVAAVSVLPWIQDNVSPNIDDRIESAIQKAIAERTDMGTFRPTITPIATPPQ